MDNQLHQGRLPYILSGESPRVLLLSGMHGDEYESGALLEHYLRTYASSLPSFLYIPQVSPSAVEVKKRKNRYGNDINRQFVRGSKDPEALSVMSLVSQYRFSLCVDVHEDPDRTLGFYLYDSEQMTINELERYRELVQQTDARLYSGVDDVDDEHLNLLVEKGYVSLGFEKTAGTAGFLSKWLYDERRANRSFTLEIPGKAGRTVKQQLISSVVPFLLTTYQTSEI